jgi:hypothetical protein
MDANSHARHARTHARVRAHTHTHTQVLSHQYKIASKLELFVGTCSDGDKMTYQKCKWKRLGYLSLDNNERSSWQVRSLSLLSLSLSVSLAHSLSLFLSLSLSLFAQARELESVHLDALFYCFTGYCFTGLLVCSQARELKSVHLDAFGRFLKVAYIYPPHTLVA